MDLLRVRRVDSIGRRAIFGVGVNADRAGQLRRAESVPVRALRPEAAATRFCLALLFRLQGGYFAMAPGRGESAAAGRQSGSAGGGSGTSLTAFRGVPRAVRESATYWLAITLAFAAVALIYLLLRSRYGLALTAVRDSEVASESQGVHVARMKLASICCPRSGSASPGRCSFC